MEKHLLSGIDRFFVYFIFCNSYIFFSEGSFSVEIGWWFLVDSSAFYIENVCFKSGGKYQFAFVFFYGSLEDYQAFVCDESDFSYYLYFFLLLCYWLFKFGFDWLSYCFFFEIGIWGEHEHICDIYF